MIIRVFRKTYLFENSYCTKFILVPGVNGDLFSTMFNAPCTWLQREAKKWFREEKEKIQNHFSNNEKKTRSWKSFSSATRRRRKKSEKNSSIFRFEKRRRKNSSSNLKGTMGHRIFLYGLFLAATFLYKSRFDATSLHCSRLSSAPRAFIFVKSSPPSSSSKSLSLLL